VTLPRCSCSLSSKREATSHHITFELTFLPFVWENSLHIDLRILYIFLTTRPTSDFAIQLAMPMTTDGAGTITDVGIAICERPSGILAPVLCSWELLQICLHAQS
jgi:hypothetical protein